MKIHQFAATQTRWSFESTFPICVATAVVAAGVFQLSALAPQVLVEKRGTFEASEGEL